MVMGTLSTILSIRSPTSVFSICLRKSSAVAFISISELLNVSRRLPKEVAVLSTVNPNASNTFFAASMAGTMLSSISSAMRSSSRVM